MSDPASYDDVVVLPRAVRFPVEMIPPEGFDAERPETWPSVPGRLECVEGRLLFLPPSGDLQQDTTTDVVTTLGSWVREHPEFVLGTNEAGMRLAGSTRAADAAIWRRADLGAYSGGLRRVPPVLAVEVAGPAQGDTESLLIDKARWYSNAGVAVVWIVLPEPRQVVVATAEGQRRLTGDERLPVSPELPGLQPLARELFVQLESGR